MQMDSRMQLAQQPSGNAVVFKPIAVAAEACLKSEIQLRTTFVRTDAFWTEHLGVTRAKKTHDVKYWCEAIRSMSFYSNFLCWGVNST